MNIHRTTSIALLVLVASGLVSTEALAAQSASGQAKVRDHRQSETPVSLKVNQRLMLTNGDYVQRSADGTVNVVGMNGRVVKSFPQGKIVKSKSGGISIISGKQRVQAGEFKAIEANVVRRDHRTEPVSEDIIAPNNRTGANIDHRTADTSENETSFDEADATFSRPVRDHRQTETAVSLKANQRLMLTNGDYVERSADGTVNIIQMNGRVVKGFPQGKIVKSTSGGITIVSGKQRVQAGEFKAIEANVVRRDHRTEPVSEDIIAPNNRTGANIDHRTADTSENETSFDEADATFSRPVRDHRQTETAVSLKANQRLMLTNGDYVERSADGTVNILGMNGRVVKSFPQGKIVKDKSGGISIISGKQRVQAGEFKAIEATAVSRDHRTITD